MNLRRKLFVTFGTFVLLGLLVAGVSIWATFQWGATGEQLQRHYTRSLEAQQVQAATSGPSRKCRTSSPRRTPTPARSSTGPYGRWIKISTRGPAWRTPKKNGSR